MNCKWKQGNPATNVLELPKYKALAKPNAESM
jgi:hypothetical protein